MKGNITFTILKPDAVKNQNIGNILADINAGGFRIVGMKYTRLRREEAEAFYGIHRERPFFKDLVDFMTSGPIVVAVLEKENAVEEFRTLIGNTDPQKADEGTIRAKYAKSIDANAVHGSDSDENARLESSFFFAQSELFTEEGGVQISYPQQVEAI
ncbi:nucleoside-diphosphate kinase [Aureibacter tunicatorum]|uniref:Nucleoside diphosphate kinase n=1 Tax=Aureibacter tunicatorum TaxID=866807 RepID=A0AAE3XL14_9BACT|nr:nucleoside-diphosphate kinase [Aureibacter tunicatorum]MDR6239811.1 nucleoside-diphosphate kinase [Aureibacter tunicatorum]BDD04286.1 nucleoside diphosphate kinase [Aureibacter tunicatorum]